MKVSEPRFAPEFLVELVELARSVGYHFFRVDEVESRPLAFYLRFDVDISPKMALELGSMLAKEQVAASFFVQLNAETYNPFAPETLATIDFLRKAGHCVGLHVDQELLGEDEMTIIRTLDWFSSCCTVIDRAVSFHRPTPTVLGKAYQSLSNAYGPPMFASECYYSDSRRSLDFVPRLVTGIAERRSVLQLLLHPEWWSPYQSPADIWEALRDRRQRELESYVVTNFRKVFGPIVELDGGDGWI